MDKILIYLFGFMLIMTIVLAPMRVEKIKAIGGFFALVLPKIPLVGMIKAYFDGKKGG